MKKRIVMFLAAAIAAMCAQADTWTDPDTGIEWTYFVSNGEASLGSGSSSGTAVDKSTTGEIVIPSSLGGCSVTSIGAYAFFGCSGLTSVTIPDSVANIGQSAFFGCSGLTNMTIPGSVTSIGSEAFSDCSGLTSVTIPNSVTNIESCAFSVCTNLASVTIPQCVLDRQIRYVFTTTYAISTYNVWTGLYDYIYDYDNMHNSAITNISCSSTITNIGNYAFSGCSGLTSVTIPDSVTSIGDYAFSGCSALTSVTIPNSVTSIGYQAFSGCSGLTAVHVTDLAAWCRISFGSYGANPLNYVHNLYLNGEKITDLTIPDGVTSIGAYAFAGCSGLKSVTMPSSVTSISSSAFSGCSGLRGVTIPNSVTSIGSSAFYGCSGLREVTIPDSVTSIGSSTFYGCSGLREVTIPDSVTSIGNYAFHNCSGLTSVTIPKNVTSLPTEVFDGCDRLWTAWYRTLANSSAVDVGGGSEPANTTIVQQVEAPYTLTDHVSDRAIASVTVDADCAIDEFVLKDGKVYDSVLYVNNTANRAVTLSLPDGYEYMVFKNAKPLLIPANSRHIITITRVADRTFLVSREELELLK